MYSTVSPFRALFLSTAAIAIAGLVASCGKPLPPEITQAPSASPQILDERGVTALVVAASTGEEERELAYRWVQLSPAEPAGTFSTAEAASTNWVAPSVEQTTEFVLRVTITDPLTRSLEADVRVAVVDVPLVNLPPEVSETISAPTSAFAGDAVPLSVTIQDPEGDPLTIAWSQLSPAEAGVFSGAGTANAVWRSPELAAGAAFQFQVSVSDGENPAVIRTVEVPIAVPTYAMVQEVFDGCGTCHTGATPDGTLDLTAGNSYAQLVDVVSVCDPLVDRVEPGNPDASALARKMTGATCGDRMPTSDPAFFDRNPGLVTRVRSWILAGAAP